MVWRDDLSAITDLSNQSPSLAYWTKILNCFQENKDNMSLNELKYLARESERCRYFWNQDRVETHVIVKNGSLREQTTIRIGLNIAKEDVSPNIHKFIETKKLELNETKIAAN